ncbi:hypothetical protein [Frankia sp. CiP3]|nr:hypothetical protein [Frankia sp. CiP3]
MSLTGRPLPSLVFPSPLVEGRAWKESDARMAAFDVLVRLGVGAQYQEL